MLQRGDGNVWPFDQVDVVVRHALECQGPDGNLVGLGAAAMKQFNSGARHPLLEHCSRHAGAPDSYRGGCSVRGRNGQSQWLLVPSGEKRRPQYNLKDFLVRNVYGYEKDRRDLPTGAVLVNCLFSL